MAASLSARSLISSWSTYPIPNLSLSAGALIALADLQTIAQRTVLAGGSSWLDALILAPGLHYQQAADAIERHFQHYPDGGNADDRKEPLPYSGGSGGSATVSRSTSSLNPRRRAARGQDRYEVRNQLVLNYLRKVCAEGVAGAPITLDIDPDTAWDEFTSRMRALMGRRRKKKDQDVLPKERRAPDLDWFSHLLYLVSPLLTVSAIAFTVLLEEWWTLAAIMALVLARIFNIYIIKQRSKPMRRPRIPSRRPLPAANTNDENDSDDDDDEVDEHGQTEYTVDLGYGRLVLLRGRPAHLRALTAHVWLRDKTHAEGFLEAGAKLLVYLVAALSGNLTQAGAIVLMSLLLASAGLLGLSNAHLGSFRMHGCVARFDPGRNVGLDGTAVAAGKDGGGLPRAPTSTTL